MQGNAASVDGGAAGDSDNVLEVLDEENPNKNTKLACMYRRHLQLNTYDAPFCGGQELVAETGRGRRNAHIPICFGGELPAHSQDKGGPKGRCYED